MDWHLIIGSGGLLGVFYLIFKTGRMVENFESRFNSIDRKLETMSTDIKSLTSRIDRLEVRVEERTLKVVHVQRRAEEELHASNLG